MKDEVPDRIGFSYFSLQALCIRLPRHGMKILGIIPLVSQPPPSTATPAHSSYLLHAPAATVEAEGRAPGDMKTARDLLSFSK